MANCLSKAVKNKKPTFILKFSIIIKCLCGLFTWKMIKTTRLAHTRVEIRFMQTLAWVCLRQLVCLEANITKTNTRSRKAAAFDFYFLLSMGKTVNDLAPREDWKVFVFYTYFLLIIGDDAIMFLAMFFCGRLLLCRSLLTRI